MRIAAILSRSGYLRSLPDSPAAVNLFTAGRSMGLVWLLLGRQGGQPAFTSTFIGIWRGLP